MEFEQSALELVTLFGARTCIEEAALSMHHPRRSIPKWRGELTQQKILRILKNKVRQSASGPQMGWVFVQCFETPQELAAHTYWHGSGGGVCGGLRPSIAMSDRELGTAGGGYGEKYWGISVSKNKNTASNFTGVSDCGSVYMVVLHKDAVVREMTDLQDAAEIEEHIVALWQEGVDAVWIGRGEEELVVLNPKAVWIGNGEYYKVFQKKMMEQPAPDDVWKSSRELEGKAAEDKEEKKHQALRNNVARWESFTRQHPSHAPGFEHLERAKEALAAHEAATPART